FGGAGGLHATDVARELGMREILIPLSPGILCAEGVAVSDLEESFVATCRTAIDQDLAPVQAALKELSARAEDWLAQAGDRGSVSATLEMRYVGQNYELAIPLDGERGAALPDVPKLRALFLAEHQAKYGHHDPAARIEVVNVRLRARMGFPALVASKGVEHVQGGTSSRASVWFDAEAPVEAAMIDRSSLDPGVALSGPAIVTQFDATTVIPPGARAHVDQARNLVIEVTP
ncbi:MAG: hydantoinase/oxoprolinase family protein, partial [Pseudomonadota bacterium]|nr:hydantoinase/oxoprolinase family protein [Pseudomonadota bacterium]